MLRSCCEKVATWLLLILLYAVGSNINQGHYKKAVLSFLLSFLLFIMIRYCPTEKDCEARSEQVDDHYKRMKELGFLERELVELKRKDDEYEAWRS